MKRTRLEHIDLLVDAEDGELLTVALSSEDVCIQWRDVPAGGLGAMKMVLSEPSGTFRELEIGKMFDVPLVLIEREGIFSFRLALDGSGADLLRIDLTPEMVAGIIDALVDAIEAWET